MLEKRRHERIEVEIEIRINWLERGLEVTTTFNYPAHGTPMTLQVARLIEGNEAPILPAEVVRASKEHIAFKFIFAAA
jgi:hypothetical protein